MWQITPIETGMIEVTAVEAINRSGVHHHPEETLFVPNISYILENKMAELTVLVDPGLRKHVVTSNSRKIIQTEKHIRALEKIRSIEYSFVLLTHLHKNCAEGIMELSGKPTIYIQKKEMQYAVAPYEIERRYYGYEDQDTMQHTLHFVSAYHQFSFLSGSKQIAPGLICISLPGHTPGYQAVYVKGETKNYLIAGDLLFTSKNIDLKLPPSIRTDTAAAVLSIQKILNMNCVILPGHDASVFELTK